VPLTVCDQISSNLQPQSGRCLIDAETIDFVLSAVYWRAKRRRNVLTEIVDKSVLCCQCQITFEKA